MSTEPKRPGWLFYLVAFPTWMAFVYLVFLAVTNTAATP